MSEDWLEIRDQVHLMDAEFSSDNKPTVEQLQKLIQEKGYKATNIDIWFDTMMNFWRASADITKEATNDKRYIKKPIEVEAVQWTGEK